MNILSPVYTEKTECHDCFKCVRYCPVKAISFNNGHARIDPDLCIFCGKCVSVCPSNAKRGRDELGRITALLESRDKIILSLAPSYPGEFTEFKKSQLINGLLSLGFYAVSETALGAEIISSEYSRILDESAGRIILSTACPSAVEYIIKYNNKAGEYLFDTGSPLTAHCRMLKEIDNNIQIVFAGPCLSKKREADDNPDLIAASVTFEDIRNLFDANGISPETVSDEKNDFFPCEAGKGALYPFDGGMCESIKSISECRNTVFMSVSGMTDIEAALKNLPLPEKDENIFIELLACKGGCINGPKSSISGETVRKRRNILKQVSSNKADYHSFLNKISGKKHYFPVECSRNISVPDKKNHSGRELTAVMESIGKYSPEDELNCGGCGYNTCRDFAEAVLEYKAEAVMCVSYMRTLAQKKANAIIEKMPSGVVIADSSHKVIECNRKFAELLGEETLLLWDSRPNLEGANLEKMVPFYGLFNQVTESGREIIDRKVEYKKKVLSVTVFPVQKGQVTGAIIQDITQPWVNRDRIINDARTVIHKNLETVQKIAYLLGENAGENEVILNEIIDSFSGSDIHGDKL